MMRLSHRSGPHQRDAEAVDRLLFRARAACEKPASAGAIQGLGGRSGASVPKL